MLMTAQDNPSTDLQLFGFPQAEVIESASPVESIIQVGLFSVNLSLVPRMT